MWVALDIETYDPRDPSALDAEERKHKQALAPLAGKIRPVSLCAPGEEPVVHDLHAEPMPALSEAVIVHNAMFDVPFLQRAEKEVKP